MSKLFLTSIDLNKNELQNAAIQNLASAPSSPVSGQIYLDTGDNHLYVRIGAAWKRLDTLTAAEMLAALLTVDGAASGLDADLLDGQHGSHYLGRANHTGTQPASTISDFDTQVRTSRLDQMAAPTANVGFGGVKILNLGAPTSASDGATKAYVDAVAAGLDPKESVKAATTANVTLSGTQTIDGVALVGGDRVLVKNQTTGADNGIYVVAAGPWARAADAAAGTLTKGAYTFIEGGSTNGGRQWVLVLFNGTVGTDSQSWTQLTGASSTLAGSGLVASGNIFAVGQGAGIIVDPDEVRIDTDVVVRKATFNVGDGSATAYVLTHNLGTRDVTVAVARATTPWDHVVCDVESTSTNTVTLRFAVAPSSNQFRATIHG